MRKLIARIGIAVVTTLALVFAGTPAQASDGDFWGNGVDWRCRQDNTGYYCLHDHQNFNVFWWGTSGNFYAGYYCGYYNLPSGYWDMMSSWTNKQIGWTNVTVGSYFVAPDNETLWIMPENNSEDSLVDAEDNDKADLMVNHC